MPIVGCWCAENLHYFLGADQEFGPAFQHSNYGYDDEKSDMILNLIIGAEAVCLQFPLPQPFGLTRFKLFRLHPVAQAAHHSATLLQRSIF